MGEWQEVSDLDDCDPIKKNSDLKENQQYSVAQKLGKDGAQPLDLDDAAFPCGLVAKSFFTDKFLKFKGGPDDKVFDINSKGIAWESDIEYKFDNWDDPNWENKQWLDVKDGKSSASFLSYLKLLSYLYDIINRTLHCLDENGRSAQLPQTLRKD